MVNNSSHIEFDLECFWNLKLVGVSLSDEIAKDKMLEQYLTHVMTTVHMLYNSHENPLISFYQPTPLFGDY